MEEIPAKLQSIDSLTMFFENTRRSGGGEITDVVFTPRDKSTARITFKEPRGKLLSPLTVVQVSSFTLTDAILQYCVHFKSICQSVCLSVRVLSIIIGYFLVCQFKWASCSHSFDLQTPVIRLILITLLSAFKPLLLLLILLLALPPPPLPLQQLVYYCY